MFTVTVKYDRYDDVRYDACVVHIRPGVWFQCGCYHSDSGGESILLLIPNPMSPMSETRTVALCFKLCRVLSSVISSCV